DDLIVHRKTFPELLQCRSYRAKITMLIGTDEWKTIRNVNRMLISKYNRCLSVTGDLQKDLCRFDLRFTDYNRNTWFDDPGLLAGNGRNGVPKKLRVFNADVGDHRQEGSDDIGGIQSSSQSGFNNANGTFLLPEIEQSHQETDLKK